MGGAVCKVMARGGGLGHKAALTGGGDGVGGGAALRY